MGERLRALLETRTIPAAPELYARAKNGYVRCAACAHRCAIPVGEAGICRMRTNVGGELRVPGGYVAGLQCDPIEKKPFYHVLPGAKAMSFGMLGCDYHCAFCQNWVSSQALRDNAAVAGIHPCTEREIVDAALQAGAPVVVSTYNEPLITADWAMRIFAVAREAGLLCGFVSNGNATPEVLEFIRPCVSLYKVDLKGFRADRYEELGGKLSAVLDTIGRLKTMGFWLEIVTLVVPGFNDSPEELRDIARFIASISPEIPWHVTAFRPDYHVTLTPATPAETLIRAWETGKEEGLHFVYQGNLGSNGQRENTFCPDCGALLIERRGFRILSNHVMDGHCPKCARMIPGVF